LNSCKFDIIALLTRCWIIWRKMAERCDK